MTKYIQRSDEEAFEIPLEEVYRMACCDCGLVHDYVFIIEDGRLYCAAKRNNRSTGQRRRFNHKPMNGDKQEG